MPFTVHFMLLRRKAAERSGDFEHSLDRRWFDAASANSRVALLPERDCRRRFGSSSLQLVSALGPAQLNLTPIYFHIIWVVSDRGAVGVASARKLGEDLGCTHYSVEGEQRPIRTKRGLRLEELNPAAESRIPKSSTRRWNKA